MCVAALILLASAAQTTLGSPLPTNLCIYIFLSSFEISAKIEISQWNVIDLFCILLDLSALYRFLNVKANTPISV